MTQTLQNCPEGAYGLVLSGGVVKAAAWHVGVASALEEIGFCLKCNTNFTQSHSHYIDTYVGSSAGALICTYLANGKSPSEIISHQLGKETSSQFKPLTYLDMLSLAKPRAQTPKVAMVDPFEHFPKMVRPFLRPILKMSGLFTTQGLHDYLERNVLTTPYFEDLKPDLFIVATQLDSSKKVIFSKYHYPSPIFDANISYYTGITIADAAAATMAVPPFYSPYPIFNPKTQQTDYYIDGEIRETLSSHVATDHGRKNIICSWSFTPYHYQEEIGSLIQYGLPAICAQAIFLLIQKKILQNRAKFYQTSDLINTLSRYFDDEKLSSVHKGKIIQIIEQKLNHKKDVKYIDIYPDPSQTDLFFAGNFSLSASNMSKIYKMGRRKTFEVFSQLKF